MEDKVRAGKLKATYLYPYLSTALLSVTLEETELVPTMAVTKTGRVLWNKKFVESLTIDEIAAVLTHEIWHLLRMHAERAPLEKEMQIVWNLSGDSEINDSLKGLPKNAVYPSTFGYEDHLTAEEYYELLKKNTKVIKCSGVTAGDCGTGARGGTDERTDGTEGGSEPQKGPLTRLDKELLARHAAEQIKARGNCPDEINRWANAVLNPVVPWERELRSKFKSSVIRAMGKTDYTFAKRSRRSTCTEAILPGMITYKPKVALVIDTSGSMGDKQIDRVMAETKSLLRTLADRVYVFVTDAAVHHSGAVSSIGEIKLSGGGGTDMRVGIREAEKVKPDIIVVLSDFATPWPEHKPKAEVVGVCIHGEVAGAPDWMRVVEVKT